MGIKQSLGGWKASLENILRGDKQEFLLKRLPKNAVAAEIGVYEGDFSDKALRLAQPQRLHLIDPWKYESGDTYKNSVYGGAAGQSQAHMDALYQSVLQRFQPEAAAGRVVVHRVSSQEACSAFPDDYFDWVYIDANHQYEYVKQDLESYYPKVKKGGYLAGDDYAEGGWWQGGVKRAVDEFLARGLCEAVLLKRRQFLLRKL